MGKEQTWRERKWSQIFLPGDVLALKIVLPGHIQKKVKRKGEE
jgi:hypothetical protein